MKADSHDIRKFVTRADSLEFLGFLRVDGFWNPRLMRSGFCYVGGNPPGYSPPKRQHDFFGWKTSIFNRRYKDSNGWFFRCHISFRRVVPFHGKLFRIGWSMAETEAFSGSNMSFFRLPKMKSQQTQTKQ